MFTNWLTSPSTKMTITNSRIDGGLIDGNSGGDSEIMPLFSNHNRSQSNNNNNLMEFMVNNNMITCRSDPEVLIEIPTPGSGSGSSSDPSADSNIRFMAHGVILSAHSGYLRSAIRMDDGLQSSSSSILVAAQHNAPMATKILYLNNVTPEQFAPLLNYMYTGYLDLNVENIFGILLATHVLHMPEALEICSKPPSSLTSLGFLPSLSSRSDIEIHHQPGIHISPGIPEMITAIEQQRISSSIEQLSLPINNDCAKNDEDNGNVDTTDEDIDVDEVERQSFSNTNFNGMTPNEDGANDSEELFIDSNSEKDDATTAKLHLPRTLEKTSLKEPLPHRQQQQQQQKLPLLSNQIIKSEKNLRETRSDYGRGRPGRNKGNRKKKSSYSKPSSLNDDGLEIAKAPVPIAQCPIIDIATIQSDVKKVIIDVASCDGPVRFKRILNTAYGQTSNNLRCSLLNNGSKATKMERSQKSLSLSFHQQMAKTISQHHHNFNEQQQQQQRHQQYFQQFDELENSEKTTSTDICRNTLKVAPLHRKMNDIYVCIYCKHTFKSQYCYQKHAKRHLNPLHLSASTTTSNYTNMIPSNEERIGMVNIATTAITTTPLEQQQQKQQHQPEQQKDQIINNNALDIEAVATAMHCNQNKRSLFRKETAKHYNNNHNQNHNNHQQTHHLDSSKTTDLANVENPIQIAVGARDIKPLDMNVQYFPCKTCGCKFPSYYFVHKHRKMCHADEENEQQHQHQEQHQISIINNNNSMSKATATTTNTAAFSSITTEDEK